MDTVFIKTQKEALFPPIIKKTLIVPLIIECFHVLGKKTAVITTVFKSGHNMVVSNYRPSSILPVLSALHDTCCAAAEEHTGATAVC